MMPAPLHALRHTRVNQLMHRLLLTLRRKLPLMGSRPSPETAPRALAQPLPKPLFHPRTALSEGQGDQLHARFLNLAYPLADPVVWRPSTWQKGTRLELLNLHYMEYLEGVEDAAFERLTGSWIQHNPPFEPGYWLDHWNSYALSIRAVVWMQQFAARGLDPETPWARLFWGSLTQQLRFLEKNLELDIEGNHLVKNAKALLWASHVFLTPEGQRWGALAERLLHRICRDQLLPDGFHFERSPSYHLQVFGDLLECRSLAPTPGLVAELDRTLDRMAAVAADLMHPDGSPSLFKDGGLTMAYPPAECLEVYRKLRGHAPNPSVSIAYPDAGYFGWRQGRDLLLANCGPLGSDHLPAHAHGDALAFEWSVDGERVIVDTGVFEYHEGPRRVRSRSTAAHNTLTLDGLDQGEFWKSFRLGRRPRVRLLAYEPRGDGVTLRGEHDGYAHLPGSPLHHRTFRVAPSRVDVWDEVSGGAGQRAEARLLLHPECKVEAVDNAWLISRGSVRVRLTTPAPVEVRRVPYWPDFGVEFETTQLVLTYGGAPCAGGFLLEAL